MQFKKELNSVVEQLENQIYDLKEIEFNIFNRLKRVLVIQSAGIEIFREFIRMLRTTNPSIYLYVLAKTRDKNEIMKICGLNAEIIEFESDENYNVNLLNRQIEYLNSKYVNICVLLYNNKTGFGYENLEEIIIRINEKEYYAFNCYSTLFKIESPIMKLKSRKTYNEICNWFWEYIENIKRCSEKDEENSN